MDETLFLLTVAATVGYFTMAGVCFGFSTLVMKGLAQVPPEDATAVMQAINRSAATLAFMSVFMSAAVASLVLGVWALADWDGSYCGFLVAGAATYLGGFFMLTVVYHVPRNKDLEEVTAGTPEGDERWATYLVEWTRMNHVRAVAGIAAGALLISGIATSN